eukprot:g14832.t1
MDFGMAFEKVPHGRLISMIRSHGIEGELTIWIQNWLEGRRHGVVVEGCFSDRRPVTSGVPQGLVLGPLLFIIYINYLDVNIRDMVSKFADDTKMRGVVDNEEDYLRVQRDLDQMGQRAEEQLMEFNLDKCLVLHFGKANQGRTYTLN